MDKSKQISHQAAESDNTPIKYWGNIALASLGLLANIFLLRSALQLPETTISYVARAFHSLVILAASLVISLTIRGNQKLGAQVVFYLVVALFTSGSFIYAESALTASLSFMTIAAITISQLLPKELRRRSIFITGLAVIIMCGAAWINPAWRLPARSVVGAGLAAAIFFVTVLVAIVIRQAWGGNIRVKIISAFTVVALISLGILGTVTYFNYRNQVRQDMRQRMLNIVSLVAMNQDGDLHSIIQGPENAKDEAHINILDQNVDYLATDPDLKYIYTMRKNEQGQIYFVINARQGGESGDPIGTIYNEPSELLRTQFDTLNGPVVEEDIYTDIYGSVLPAYAPFYRSDGTREGIIGVDLDAAKVFAEESRILSLILGTTIAAMVFVILSGLFLGNVFTKPLINLSHVAHEITEGNLGARAEVETTDEFGNLAKAINQMTSQLQETLQGLEQRVADRTRHLVLAAGVGRAVSQVRDLDVMLKDACELILKEFDLYYVQVYLTAANQKSLKLEAGTGEVGAQLLRREHNLPLDINSINGRAAVEKHAVVISDTTQSATFRQNPLLPETRGEMAVPLIVAGKVVGVLDVQHREPGLLNDEILPAFEALAGQLAVAIQNAHLLEEANEARAEVEKQARRLVRQSWGEYMDAIHTPEQIGFKFDQKEVIPLVNSDESRMSENAISSSISVTGEPLGSLIVQMDESSSQDQALELVNSVAQQMARQIENLRLLESAERYRQKAELASRRLTHEGWQEYLETNAAKASGYIYNLNEVRPYRQDEAGQMEESALSLPLKIRDEAVGKLIVKGVKEDEDAVGLVNTIAEHLSQHIEGLRLSMQTEQALASTKKQAQREQALSQITSAVRGSTDPATILRTGARELGTLLGRKTIIWMTTTAQTDQAESAEQPDPAMNGVINDASPDAVGGSE